MSDLVGLRQVLQLAPAVEKAQANLQNQSAELAKILDEESKSSSQKKTEQTQPTQNSGKSNPTFADQQSSNKSYRPLNRKKRKKKMDKYINIQTSVLLNIHV
ncbi:MAG: hypothetical protein ACN4E2_01155 [Nitrospinota bacterium]